MPVAAKCRQELSKLAVRQISTGDYVASTKIPTYHFQDSLPRLPLNDLQATADRYLYAATPLISGTELETTKKIMNDFVAGDGKKLHEFIVEREKTRYSSFISEPWFDMYLTTRDPLPLNINPQMTFFNDPIEAKNEQVTRAALLAWCSARFYRTLKDEKLPPDLFHTQACMGGTGTGFFSFLNGKGGSSQFDTVCSMTPKSYAFYAAYLYGSFPLDMSQYKNLFNSTRIPKRVKDELKISPKGNHVVVQCRNEFWKVDILRDDGSVVPAGEIMSCFRHIMNTPNDPSSLPVGILTTADRDSWADAREKLEANPKNKATLEMIDSALFAICLEDSPVAGFKEQQELMLHGAGRNRWFDKSFQLIVLPTGRAAVNFEHSWGDGVAVLRYFNEVNDDSKKAPIPTELPAKSAPKRLVFEHDAASKDAIQKATVSFDKTIDSVRTEVLEYAGFSSKYIKSKGLGLDGCLQMSFQLAHYRLFGKTVSTYESANQSAYKHGRTETIRSATVESDTMCKVFFDKNSTRQQKEEALRTAVANHGRLTKEALMGKGWDRHMFALKYEAKQQGMKLHPIYEDVSNQKLSEIIMSTSTLSSPNIDGGGFGPVGPNCFGIGYTSGRLRGVEDPALEGVEGFASSIMSYTTRNTAEFRDSMRDSL